MRALQGHCKLVLDALVAEGYRWRLSAVTQDLFECCFFRGAGTPVADGVAPTEAYAVALAAWHLKEGNP